MLQCVSLVEMLIFATLTFKKKRIKFFVKLFWCEFEQHQERLACLSRIAQCIEILLRVYDWERRRWTVG